MASPDQGYQRGVVGVVVEGIAVGEAFQRHPRGAVEPLGLVLVRGTEQAAKSLAMCLPNSSVMMAGIASCKPRDQARRRQETYVRSWPRS